MQCLRFSDVVLLSFLSITSLPAISQSPINGRVTGRVGEVLPGVNVHVVGTTHATSTDRDGNFAIIASEGAVLEFSHVTISIATRRHINSCFLADQHSSTLSASYFKNDLDTLQLWQLNS